MTGCSVIMVSYHTGPVLFVSVKSVLRQQQLAEVIVVDNGNPPDVLARLQQMSLTEPRLKIVTGGGNAGYARACNMGVRQATGDFLLLLNPDCLLPPEALSDMMNALNTWPDAKLATAWLQNPEGKEQKSDRRRLLTPGSLLKETFGLHRLRGETAPPPNETHEVSAISNACMCLRRRDYNRVGGMDEKFFLPVADLDMCMRIHKGGGKILRLPQVKVTHMPGPSSHLSPAALEWHKAKGLMHYFSKHFRQRYVPGFLLMVNLLLMARFVAHALLATLYQRLKPKSMLAHSVAAKKLMVLALGLVDLPEKNEFSGKTVLVTGATSQVGLCVVRRMLASGAAVLALSRGEPIPFAHENLRWIKADLADEKLHLQGYLIDMVVHCAPLPHLPPMLHMLSDAEVKRIIAFSSTSVFANAMSRNAQEMDLVEKLTRAEKEIADRCQPANIQWTILRPTLTYGVGLDLNITSLAKFIDRFGFFPVYPPAFGRRQPVHADDLALAVMQAATTAQSIGKSYNLSGGEVLTYRQMLERLFTVCDKKLKIIETTLLPFMLDIAGLLPRFKHLNGEIARRMNDDLIFFHDEASKDFRFNPRPFLSGGIKDIEGF